MDFKTCAATLLVLGLMAVPVHSNSNPLCGILNETLSNSTSNVTLQVIPETLFYVNHTYTVKLSGTGNITVILQALPSSSNSSGSSVGHWSNTTEHCDGNPLFQGENVSVSVNWTSPDTVQSVVIYAYIKEGSDVFRNEVRLDAVPDTTGNATTGNVTTTEKPGTTATKITSTTAIQTTSASSVIHPSSLFMALTETIGLLLITSKLLS
eukprot:XP_002942468.1 PREDICTED: placenta-expressed transcript 1 protein-like [Xenopus tropicalis]